MTGYAKVSMCRARVSIWTGPYAWDWIAAYAAMSGVWQGAHEDELSC